jgi:uncharacterized protein (TIGR03067 family)
MGKETGILGKGQKPGLLGTIGGSTLSAPKAKAPPPPPPPSPPAKPKLPKYPAPLPPPVTVPSSQTIGGVAVAILADQTNIPGLKSSAETKFSITGTNTPGASTKGGKITSLTGPLPAPKVTIQTSYLPGTSATQTSGYGRGTTTADLAAGKTSLGFHESCHRQDYQDFLKNNPFPTFAGKVGDTVAQYQKAQRDYKAAVEAYDKKMNAYSLAQTDEVGYKQSAFKKAKAEQARLKGTWTVVSLKKEGVDQPANALTVVEWEIDDNFITWKGTDARTFSYTRLDVTNNPATVDLLEPGDQPALAIYQLSGKNLTFCLSEYGRPAGFASTAADHEWLFVLKRK